jgi:hypothetical protein
VAQALENLELLRETLRVVENKDLITVRDRKGRPVEVGTVEKVGDSFVLKLEVNAEKIRRLPRTVQFDRDELVTAIRDLVKAAPIERLAEEQLINSLVSVVDNGAMA